MMRSPALRWMAIGMGAIVLSLLQAGLFRQALFNFDGLPLLGRFFRAAIRPDLSTELLALTFRATLTTFAYGICGTFFSVVLGIVSGILSSEVWWFSWGFSSRFWIVVRVLIAFPRAVHELIWGLFFLSIWGLDPLVGIVAIALPFGAITAKVFSEILDDTPRQPLIILLNSGVSPWTAFFYSLLPQAFLNLVSYTFYRFECSIRSAAVLGIIGAGGLGYEIFLSLQSLRYEQLWTFFYALVILNGSVDVVSALLRRRLGCVSRLDLNLPQNQRSDRRTASSKAIFLLLLSFLLLLGLSVWYIHPNFGKLWSPRTAQLLAQVARSTFPPDFSGASQIFVLSIETVAMSVLAIAFATLGGLLLAFPAAHNFFLPGGLLNPNPKTERQRYACSKSFISSVEHEGRPARPVPGRSHRTPRVESPRRQPARGHHARPPESPSPGTATTAASTIQMPAPGRRTTWRWPATAPRRSAAATGHSSASASGPAGGSAPAGRRRPLNSSCRVRRSRR
ncbi:MAG: ABC transporter permease subunit [Leptolyngbyaceae cyanobacterium CSU_1_3]|nr:ABC transporter permease subunit [Leptolyngbyaceae cyanobacterium CSU_1_3]